MNFSQITDDLFIGNMPSLSEYDTLSEPGAAVGNENIMGEIGLWHIDFPFETSEFLENSDVFLSSLAQN